MTTMRCAVVREHGVLDAVSVEEQPVPEPSAGEPEPSEATEEIEGLDDLLADPGEAIELCESEETAVA